jgi:hypothetical protein
VDPDPDSESGSRRAKMTKKYNKVKKFLIFEVLDVLFSPLVWTFFMEA